MHDQCGFAGSEHQFDGVLLRPGLPGGRKRGVRRLSCEHLVLDRGPQHVSCQHFVACPVGVARQLHVSSWLHRRRWLGVLAVRSWHVQDRGWKRQLYDLPFEQLLRSGCCESDELSFGQQQLACWLDGRVAVPVQPRILWIVVQPVFSDVLLPWRRFILHVSEQRLHHRWRQHGVPVHVSGEFGPQRIEHLRVRGGLPAHCRCSFACRLAVRRVSCEFVLRGWSLVPVPSHRNISSRIRQLLGVPVPCSDVYDGQHGRLSPGPQLRKLRREQVLHLQHPMRRLPDQLHLASRHRLHQRVRVRRQHVRRQLRREQPDVQRVPSWLLLPRRRLVRVPRQFLLHRQHSDSSRLPCAVHFVDLFQLLFRLPVRRWILHERRRVLDVWVWHIQRQGHRRSLQRMSFKQQHVVYGHSSSGSVFLQRRICWRCHSAAVRWYSSCIIVQWNDFILRFQLASILDRFVP